MATWIDSFRKQAELLLKKGVIREILFSGSTYQIEVEIDQEIFWPFLQFHEEGGIKDAFCSCAEEGGCLHLAVAHQRIMQGGVPIHVQFAGSLWHILFQLLADHFHYAAPFEEKEGRLFLQKEEIALSWESGDSSLLQELHTLLFQKVEETPENSIKFSDLPPQEIAKWREGRASNDLRFILSPWSSLAKWLFLRLQEEPYRLLFEEREGLPTSMHLHLDKLSLHISYGKEVLIKIIPFLRTVATPLLVSEESLGEIEKITFDEKRLVLRIQHKKKVAEEPGKTRVLEGWLYRSGIGFYAQKGGSFFDRQEIPKEEMEEALTSYSGLLGKEFKIAHEPESVRYKIFFDKAWNLHLHAFLAKEGDVQAIIGKFLYLGEGRFQKAQDLLFPVPEKVILAKEVADFVTLHRIWLGNFQGFHTHLSSMESQLSYRIEGEKLLFFSKTQEGEKSHDFGEWVYHEGQGFFSKMSGKTGQIVRAGVEVALTKISSFIKLNREELEFIPHFFSPLLPIEERGLSLMLGEMMQLCITPFYEPREKNILFFDDFAYVEGEGFSLLPPEMRLPQAYQEPVCIDEKELGAFFSQDFPLLMKGNIRLDPRLRLPTQEKLTLEYLVRNPKGGVKAKIFYNTEMGKISFAELLQALSEKKTFLFSPAGFLDLKSPSFDSLRQLRAETSFETLEISTLDFMRLDATLELHLATTGVESVITEKVLKELRDFSVSEKPQLKGLACELRRYQQTGVQWLWFLYKNGLSALLCDDMGLGKTHQAMALMAAIIALKEPSQFLVVCPTSVIYHWQDKLAKYLPHVKVHTFHGLKREADFPANCIVLTTYGTLRVEKETFKGSSFDLAVFDEIQLAKNAQSQLHEALKGIASSMRLGLTGTPIENNLHELKALLDIVLPGYMPSSARFRTHFIQPIEEGNGERKALLSRLIKPFILRRKKSEVLSELPEKCEDKALCDLSREQEALYKETLKAASRSVRTDLSDGKGPIPYIHIFSILSRLKQICDHPALLAKDVENFRKHASGKWDLFVELLAEARESAQKVVVFSQYLSMLDIMEKYLTEEKIGFAQIRGSTVHRREELARFAEDPFCLVFLGSLQAAGLGIDLTAASVVILYDRWWNSARENQAIDRVHRMGQKWKVHVFKLLTKKTIEEKIDLMIERKGALLEEIVIAEDQAILKKFTREELLELFTY